MSRFRNALAALLALMLLLAATPALALSSPATLHRSGDEASPQIAITIDDCYHNGCISDILDLCDQYGIHVTFFPVGKAIDVEDRDLWRRVVDGGHEIGNHTYAHDNMPGPRMTVSRMLKEFTRTEVALNEALGYEYFMRCYRPPYGKQGGVAHKRQVTADGYPDMVLWSVSQTNPDKALQKTKNGSILLFHAKETDVKCLTTLIPRLLEKGFEPVTVTELLGLAPISRTRDGVTVTSNGGRVESDQAATAAVSESFD